MSGVIDDFGQQWERCHTCCMFIKFPQKLGYTKNYASHICLSCANKLPQKQLEAVIPAPGWKPVYA